MKVISNQPILAKIASAVILLTLLAIIPARAQNCAAPVNLATDGSFDRGLSGFENSGGWLFNQPLDPAIYGTTYISRAAVQNSAAAPVGPAATAYPAASLNAFALNENDGANDSITLSGPAGNFVSYYSESLHIWLDMGWRQAGGNPTYAATLKIKVDGVTYMTITTVNGNDAGSATGAVAGGGLLGANTPSSYPNSGGAGSLSTWNTIHLIVPYSGTGTPNVSFVIAGGSGTSDDFAIDRIYVPLCQISAINVSKSSTVISDPANGTSNPKAIPGATIRYCIVAENPSSNPSVTALSLSDDMSGLPYTVIPSSIRVNGSVTAGQCNWDGVVGGSFLGGVVTATLNTLTPGTATSAYFDVVLD
jgi:hypothetical protein